MAFASSEVMTASGRVALSAGVEAFGGKAAFNALVREMLNIDFYETWIKEPGAG
jgi:hypothetical protein